MLESIVKFATHNRYTVIALVTMTIILGINLGQHLPVDAVPDITNTQVQINTLAPGFSPFEVENQVTFPIETALSGIPGLETTRSLSRNGFSQVTAIFTDSTDIYFARQQVTEKLNEAKEILPNNVDPKMGPISTGLGEIYMWTLQYDTAQQSSDSQIGFQKNGDYITPEGTILKTTIEKLSYLRTLQDWLIKPQMRAITGIAGIDSIGGYVKQFHVQPNPEKLIALGLSFEDITQVIEQNNVSIGAGYIERNGESLNVRSDGRIENIPQLENIVVATRDGTPIYLKDVATIEIGKELRTGSASKNGQEVVVGTALMLIGANSRDVATAAHEKFQSIKNNLPTGIKAEVVLNRTKLVNATLNTVAKNLAEGALLVIIVLFLMLKNIRAALITASIIPMTMIFTSMGMIATKTSANLMSLGALDFGLLVDGTVIIIENYIRRLQSYSHILTTKERLKEVIESTKEMSKPTLFGQMILILVYVPLLTFTGIEGKMFYPMAITVIIALLSAFVLSITFVPAMAALFIKSTSAHNNHGFLEKLDRLYLSILKKSLQIPKIIILAASSFFIISFILFTHLGQEFIPTLDEQDLAVHAVRIPSTSLTQSQDMQFNVEKTLKSFDEVDYVFSKTGTAEVASDPMPPNTSDTFVILKPKGQWPDPTISKVQLIDKFEERLHSLIGNVYEFTQPIQMRFNELIAGVRADIAVKIYGDNFAQLNKIATDIAEILQKTKGGTDVKVEQTTGLPMLNIKLNYDKMARLGLNVSTVLNTISIAIGGKPSGLVFEGDKRFDIIVKLNESYRENLVMIDNLPIFLKDPIKKLTPTLTKSEEKFTSIPLREIASVVIEDGPYQISRENGKRRITVQANIRGSDTNTFVQQAQNKLANIKLPTGYWIEWGGQFKNLAQAKERLLWIIPLCFLAIFLILFSALNSILGASFIFTAIPLALTGGVLSLFLRGIPFSISAAVGFIALSGIAVLNGLVMVTTINKEFQQNSTTPIDAIIKGATTRLRPVLMTALVASLGFIPMALATGTGAEVQKPLATVVIGGLITSTLLTLIIIPVLYLLFPPKSVNTNS
ncbi:MAG: CusA/CzcA family heavy metal efflux RND transporter [Candidatus Paracaedibacteraceae bacterium]|nr:CusA/CzcA family heavy metal efflux RND transporter [Candidatus Paracaedibacteraceae bacterium]